MPELPTPTMSTSSPPFAHPFESVPELPSGTPTMSTPTMSTPLPPFTPPFESTPKLPFGVTTMSTSSPPSSPPPSTPPPSTPPPSTPPLRSAREFGTTPVRPARYTAMKELLADQEHKIAGRALHPIEVEPDAFWRETIETSDGYEAAQLSDADLTTLNQQYRKLGALSTQSHKAPESRAYVPSTIIMNVLSLAEAKARPLPDDQVVGWFLNPTQTLSGDPCAKSLKPDLVAYLVPRQTAEEYLTRLRTETKFSNKNGRRPAWAQMISAAEVKVSAPPQAQLLHYLEAICCYRPDLVSVVGMSSKLSGCQFYSLNAARCLKCSATVEWNNRATPSLQKFVAAVYQTHRSRYDMMNYLPNSLQVWSLEGGSESVRRWDMLPFHAGHYPGRGTWVACAIEATKATEATEATDSAGAATKVHIVKIYWADAGTKWGEGDLYRDAHDDEKIPGLAHVVDHWKTGKVVSGSRKPGGSITKREQVCVILGSIGRPLNECKDVDQILGCVFDLLETLRVMCDRDVIHRDISWGNVMINPPHTDSVAGPVVGGSDEQRPCYISEILGKEVSGSLSLLTDLDCSAKLQRLREDAKPGHHWRVGTPGFIAMEISSRNVQWCPFPYQDFGTHLRTVRAKMLGVSCSRFKSLERKVMKQMMHAQQYGVKDLFDFVDSNPTSGPEQEPEQTLPLVHTPRHDAESVFWLLWFLLARANPKGETRVAENSVEAAHYDAFCSTILNHTVGATGDTRYLLACRSIDQYRQSLHPRFAHLGDMLYYMGHYFLIDPKTWRDYSEDPLGHAFAFMQFLLLREMLRKDEPRNEVSRSHPLDTTEPRPAIDSMAQVRRHSLQVGTRSVHMYASSLSSVSSSGSKPDRAEANEQDGGATEDQGKLLDPDVERFNDDYVETEEQLQEAFEKLSQFNSSLVQALGAAKVIQESMLRGERWFTVLPEE